MQTTTSPEYTIRTGTDARTGQTFYEVHADGLLTRVGRESVWYTREDAEAALARKIAEPVKPVVKSDGCRYCGLPTRRGVCVECGTEPSMIDLFF